MRLNRSDTFKLSLRVRKPHRSLSVCRWIIFLYPDYISLLIPEMRLIPRDYCFVDGLSYGGLPCLSLEIWPAGFFFHFLCLFFNFGVYFSKKYCPNMVHVRFIQNSPLMECLFKKNRLKYLRITDDRVKDSVKVRFRGWTIKKEISTMIPCLKETPSVIQGWWTPGSMVFCRLPGFYGLALRYPRQAGYPPYQTAVSRRCSPQSQPSLQGW